MRYLRIAVFAQMILATGCPIDPIPAGEPCSVGDACQGQYVCLEGACRMPCNSDEVCARVETCTRGVCMPATDGGEFGDPGTGDAFSGDAGWGDSAAGDPGGGGDVRSGDTGTGDSGAGDR